MHWSEFRQSRSLPKPYQQGTLHMISCRRYHHARRFIRDKNILITIKDDLWFLSLWFIRHFFRVNHGAPVSVWRIALQHTPVFKSNEPSVGAIPPQLRVNVGEANHEILEDRMWWLIEFWQIKPRVHVLL